MKNYIDKIKYMRYNIIVEKTKGTPQNGYAQKINAVIASLGRGGDYCTFMDKRCIKKKKMTVHRKIM